MAAGGSNILTREEDGRKEIILSSQSGKGSAETQRVRNGRGGSIITDSSEGNEQSGKTPSQQHGHT